MNEKNTTEILDDRPENKGLNILEDEKDLEYSDPLANLMEDINGRFGSMPTNARCAVHRIEPDWCEGHIETIPIGDNFDLDTIKKRFGGHIFNLRIMNQQGKYIGQKRVHIAGPPKIDGVIIYHPEKADLERDRQESAHRQEKEIMMLKQTMQQPQNQGSDTMATMFGLIINMMDSHTKSQMEMMTKIAKSGTQNNQNPMASFLETYQLIKAIEGGKENPPDEGDQSAIPSMIMKFMESMNQKKEAPQMPFIGQRATGINPTLNPPQQQQKQSIVSTPPINEPIEDEETEVETMSLAEELGELDAKESADLMMEVYENFSDEKKMEMMQRFTGGMKPE